MICHSPTLFIYFLTLLILPSQEKHILKLLILSDCFPNTSEFPFNSSTQEPGSVLRSQRQLLWMEKEERYFCFYLFPLSSNCKLFPPKGKTQPLKLAPGEMCPAWITGPAYFIYSFPHNFFVFLLRDIFVLVEWFNRQFDLLGCFFLNQQFLKRKQTWALYFTAYISLSITS